MPKPEPVELVFSAERETRNKTRFQEMTRVEGSKPATPAPKEKAVIEKLYVSKSFLKKWGNPDTLIVTISAP